jgi:pimeloyl-ACP methyl ester carboxylesterase
MLLSSSDTGSDIDIAHFEAGRGDPVVLVHGLGDDHRAWRKVVASLMLTRRVILYDFRGHGGTSLGSPKGSLRQLADDLAVLLDGLAIERAVLVGFSLGGTIAMRTAIDRPGRVSGLALVATSSRVNSAARQWYSDRAGMVERGDADLRAILDRDTEDVYRHRPAEIGAGLLIRRQSTADPRGYANACTAMASLRDEPLDGELGAISVPTIILAGDADQHCPPRAGQIIADRIVGSELQIIADSGHPLPVERPAEVATAVETISCRAG